MLSSVRGSSILMIRCRTIYPIILLFVWLSVFTFVFVTVRQRATSTGLIPEFDDVRSRIPGALTNDDVIETSDDIITNNDDAPQKHGDMEATTRADFEFGPLSPGQKGLLTNDENASVGNDVLNQVDLNNSILSITYPHGDLKLPDSENNVGNYMEKFLISNVESEHSVAAQHEQEQPEQLEGNVPVHYDVTQESVAAGALQFDVGHVSGQTYDVAEVSDDIISHGDESLHLESAEAEDTEFNKVVDLDPGRFSMQVTNHMLDHFQVKLPPLLEGYKNPCWVEQVPEDFTYADSYFNTCNTRMNSGEIRYKGRFETFQVQVLNKRAKFGAHWRTRCFPYFFLLGVGKCGTTDLFLTLKTYSKYLAPIFLKEPHYWEWKRCHHKMHCHGRKRNPKFSEYLDALDPASERVRQEKIISDNGTTHNPLIIGDFTPSTLTFYPCWQNQPGNTDRQEPLYTTAHHIYSIRPQTKFIVIMRDPVERIFSNYKMKFRLANQQGDENARLFHAEMLNATTHLTACMRTSTPRACAYSVMRFDFMTHVSNSMYEIFIRDWLSVFPRDQFLFLRMEDYMESRVPNVKAILKFLELEELSPVQEQEMANKAVTNKAPETEAMFDETKELLRDFFRPFNSRLVELLGDESYSWGY